MAGFQVSPGEGEWRLLLALHLDQGKEIRASLCGGERGM